MQIFSLDFEKRRKSSTGLPVDVFALLPPALENGASLVAENQKRAPVKTPGLPKISGAITQKRTPFKFPNSLGPVIMLFPLNLLGRGLFEIFQKQILGGQGACRLLATRLLARPRAHLATRCAGHRRHLRALGQAGVRPHPRRALVGTACFPPRIATLQNANALALRLGALARGLRAAWPDLARRNRQAHLRGLR